MALLDNLSVFYPLATDANDDHTLGPYDLTSVGTPAFSGGFAVLEGNTDYFHVASNTDLQGAGLFSVACWLKLPTLASFAVLVSKWGGTSGTDQEWRLEFNHSSTRFNFTTRNTAEGLVGVAADNFGAPSIDTEYFLAGGYSTVDDVVWISVNAGTVNTAGHGGLDVDTGTYRLEVGAAIAFLGQANNSSLRRVGFWKRDIRTDLSALYNSGAGLDYAGMVGGSPTMSPAQAAAVLTGYGMSLGFTIHMPDEA